MDYNIKDILQIRINDIPVGYQKPIEEDYWGKLFIKGHEEPTSLTIGQVFELGRICERYFQLCVKNNEEKLAMQVISYTRRLNGIFEK